MGNIVKKIKQKTLMKIGFKIFDILNMLVNIFNFDNLKKKEEYKILTWAHLTGKASTDAIRKQVSSTTGGIRWFSVSP